VKIITNFLFFKINVINNKKTEEFLKNPSVLAKEIIFFMLTVFYSKVLRLTFLDQQVIYLPSHRLRYK